MLSECFTKLYNRIQKYTRMIRYLPNSKTAVTIKVLNSLWKGKNRPKQILFLSAINSGGWQVGK